jgi:hypothetical protein
MLTLLSGESFAATAAETNGAPGTSSRESHALAGGVRRGCRIGSRAKPSLARRHAWAAPPSGPKHSCAACSETADTASAHRGLGSD